MTFVLGMLLGQLPYNAGIVHVQPLPASAKIVVQPWRWDSPVKVRPGDECPYTARLSGQRVRRMFATYHLLRQGEEHDFYAWYGCSASGTLTVDDKSFNFIVRPLNLLSTNWPDGHWKPLGGKHSDDPSGN